MIPVFDGHLDSLQRLYVKDDEPGSLVEETDKGHFDLQRARKGNFAGGLFAIFVPSTLKPNPDLSALPGKGSDFVKPLDGQYAEKMARKGIDCLNRFADRSGGMLRVAASANDVVENMAQGLVSAVLHFEGAEPIAPDLGNLQAYYDRGLRSIGMVWSRQNAFGHGVEFRFPGSPDMGPGLTDAGIELVNACNRLGIVIDLSHLNEKGFWDVQRLSDAPLVATHSCMHALVPISRNLTDKQLDAVKDSNGVVGIAFCTAFLRKDAKLDTDTPIDDIVRHIAYAVDRMGEDHVAIGSDFDGATIPGIIGDVSGLPKLISALSRYGFDASTIRKIAYENWIRVFSDSWR